MKKEIVKSKTRDKEYKNHNEAITNITKRTY
jgi:hypothetical protein